jgi:site-specific recombinase XerD
MMGEKKRTGGGGRVTQLTMEAACQHFLLAKRRENCSERTIVLYDNWLSRWRRFLQQLGFSGLLGDLTLAEGQSFADHLHGIEKRFKDHPFAEPRSGKLSSNTIHQAIRIIRTFGNWLHKRGYTESHLFRELELPRLKKRVIEILSQDEIKAILESIDRSSTLGARDYALMVLGLDTGIRQGEMSGLRLRDLNLEAGQMKVLGKGNKERFVPFGVVAQEALRRYIDIYRPEPYYAGDDFVFLSNAQTQLTGNGIVHLMRRIAERSGVSRLHCHLLRHTFGVQYLINGGDIVSLQMILGHEDLETTRIYLQLARSHVTLQHNRFSPMDNLELPGGLRGRGTRRKRRR